MNNDFSNNIPGAGLTQWRGRGGHYLTRRMEKI